MIKLLAVLKIKPTEKVLTIIMIVFLVLIILGGGFAAYYLHGISGEKDKQIEDLDKKVKEAQDKVAKIPAIENKIDEIKPYIEKLQHSIPTFSFFNEYDDLAIYLEKIFKEAQVIVPETKFQIGEPGKSSAKDRKTALPSNVNEVTCDIKLKGTFINILRFMNLIENSERFILLEDFKPVRGSGGTDELALTLRTFTYKGTPPPQPKATTTAGATTPSPD